MADAIFTSARTTTPDWAALLASLRTAVNDPTAAFVWKGDGNYRVKKTAAFTAPQLAAAQTAIDTAPALTLQRQAQNDIDAWPIMYRALVFALMDGMNVVRTSPAPWVPKAAVTEAQVIASILTKAGQL